MFITTAGTKKRDFNQSVCLPVKKSSYLIKYTFVFLITAFFVFLPFITNNKSLVYIDTNKGGDGLVIHYCSFVYYGQYLRNIIRSFFETGKFTIPMWDLHIGFGQDIIQTLWFYAIGDPFAFLSVFIPTRYSEIGYCIITVLELYCAGLAFSGYAFYMKKQPHAVLIASLVYVFSSYPLLISTLHPYFTLPMILLPMLLLGAERLIKKRFDTVYIFGITLAACSCFYFFYMLCIFVLLYALLRFFCTYRCTFINILKYGLKFLGNTILGIGMSAILLLPVIFSLVATNRVSASNFVPLFYPIKYYKQLLAQLMVGGGDYYNHQGYTAIAAFSLIVLIVLVKKEKKYRQYALVLVLLSLFVCIPFFGHMFNGFAYVTNRWIWAFDCFIAYIVATMIPEFESLEKKQWSAAVIVSVIYILSLLLFRDNRTGRVYVNCIVLLILILFISGVRSIEKKRVRLYHIAGIAFSVATVVLNAVFINSPEEGNYIRFFGNRGKALVSLTKKTPGHLIAGLQDDGLFRYDTAGIEEGEVKRNSDMLLQTNGSSHYFSTNGGDYASLFNDMEMNIPMEQTYSNLDQRLFLDAISGVRYYVIANGAEEKLPFIYDKVEASGKKYSIYTSDSVLPMAFATDKLISFDQYTEANSVKKQQMLLQGISIQGVESEEYIETSDTSREISYVIDSCDGIETENNRIYVNKPNASMVLSFSGQTQENEELYCRFVNLNYSENQEKSGWIQKVTADTLTSALITLEPDRGFASKVHVMNNQNPYYCGHHNFLVNLGRNDEERTQIKISFNNAGMYSFDAIELYAQPLDAVKEQILSLPDAVAENVEISRNYVSGQINAVTDEYLFVSILYGPGWKAYVDGVSAAMYKADNAFIAIPVKAGQHTFELKYTTPMLKEGFLISILSLVITLMTGVILKRQEKNSV